MWKICEEVKCPWCQPPLKASESGQSLGGLLCEHTRNRRPPPGGSGDAGRPPLDGDIHVSLPPRRPDSAAPSASQASSVPLPRSRHPRRSRGLSVPHPPVAAVILFVSQYLHVGFSSALLRKMEHPSSNSASSTPCKGSLSQSGSFTPATTRGYDVGASEPRAAQGQLETRRRGPWV